MAKIPNNLLFIDFSTLSEARFLAIASSHFISNEISRVVPGMPPVVQFSKPFQAVNYFDLKNLDIMRTKLRKDMMTAVHRPKWKQKAKKKKYSNSLECHRTNYQSAAIFKTNHNSVTST